MLTWIGISFFLVAFMVVLWICNHAVTRQRKRFKKEKEEVKNE